MLDGSGRKVLTKEYYDVKAEAVSIIDAGGLYVADDAEDALAEVMTDLDIAEAAIVTAQADIITAQATADAAQTDIDGFPDELKNLVTAEIQQLELIGATTISASQWGHLGALTTDPIGGDGTAGRILRQVWLFIKDGTNASTLKCTVTSNWNGDTIAETDNIVKNAITGHFRLDAGGIDLRIKATGLTGNGVFAFGTIHINASGTDLTLYCVMLSDDIRIRLYHATTGVVQDITAMADGGDIRINILYLTDA